MESIISSLFSSLNSTLRSQLVTATSSFVLKNETTPSFPSSLPSLWSSQLSTQIVLLATQLSLDTAMTSALQQIEKGNKLCLESFCEEMDKLVATGVKMLQGQPAESESEDSSIPTHIDAAGEMYLPRERDSASGVPVTPHQAVRLRSVLLILHSHHQRALKMTQHVAEEPVSGSSHLTSFLWESSLHWTWSSTERTCNVTTLGAQLSYGFHYMGTTSRVVLTPSTERALVFLLQAVHQGNNTIMTGPEVGQHSAVEDREMLRGKCIFSSMYM